jgi:glutathione S-transferase
MSGSNAMQGDFFLGEQFSYVDAMFVPFVERMVGSLSYHKGFHMRGTEAFPGLEAWFAALETRPAYLASRSDHYTHAHDLPPQLGGTLSIL